MRIQLNFAIIGPIPKKNNKLPYTRMSLINLLKTTVNPHLINYRDLYWIDVARKHRWPY